ncbi:MAG: M28 family peptidase [bacterium]|nr:M28 family peptidase [bacterium]
MRLITLGTLSLCVACAGSPPIPDGWEGAGTTHAYHDGPRVAYGMNGPARFVSALLNGFDADAAMEMAAFADRFYREPANEGFDAVLDRVHAELSRVGFGTKEGLELRVVEHPMDEPAWTPRRAELALIEPGAGPETLLRFDTNDDRQRTMLSVGAGSHDGAGRLVFRVEDLAPGTVLVTDQPVRDVLEVAAEAGAFAVLSSYLRDYNRVDPTGEDRARDSILYTSVPQGTAVATLQISPRAHEQLAAAAAGSRARIVSEVDFAERPLRTVIATVVGARRPDQIVPMVAHVQGPGASDNASGVAGLLEAARTLAHAIETETLARPGRGVAFVWGSEFVASRAFLDSTEREVVAGFSADMFGASKERTGAICLLERAPDPGTLTPLPPDEHTPRTVTASYAQAGDVRTDEPLPNGLNIVTRLALVDVGLAAGGWETREHPWEGGRDHDVFLGRGIPAVQLWHFTDFAYHTNLDRLEHVDSHELALTSVALLCAALAVADGAPTDLTRYLASMSLERRLRLATVEIEGADREVAEQWIEWFTGARHWLRSMCLDLEFS